MTTAAQNVIDAAFEMMAATKKEYPKEGSPEFFALTDVAHRLECACLAYKAAAVRPTPPVSTSAEKCIGLTPGWVPTYNDPDNAGCKPEAEPIYASHPTSVALAAAEELMTWLRPLLVISGDLSEEQARIASILSRHFPAHAREDGERKLIALLMDARNVMQISANIQDQNRGGKGFDLAVGLKRVVAEIDAELALRSAMSAQTQG